MKILFVNEYSAPHAVSGAEHSMQALAEGLRYKHEVFVLSPDLGGESQDLKFPFLKKIKPGQVLSPIWFNNPIFWFYSGYQIEKAVKDNKIDLIHVHGKYIQPGAVMAGRLTKKPVVTTVRDFKFLCPLALCYLHRRKKCSFFHYLFSEIPEFLNRYSRVSFWSKPWLVLKLVGAKIIQIKMKWFLNQSAQVIAVSPQLKQIYADNGVRRLTSIYNLPPEASVAKPSLKTKNLVSIGKLSYGKGTDTLLAAMKLVPKAKLILAGEINPSIKDKFPENVKYVGKVSHEQALKLYSQAAVFVILSRWPEPLSRAGLEALSAGLPIIASNRGGNNELVQDNGWVVSPDDVGSVASAIKEMLKTDLSKFSHNSTKLYQTRFSRSRIIDKHLNLYQELI